MNLSIIKNRRYYFTLSLVLVLVSLLALIAWGLKPGIDFIGGSLLEIQFKQRPSVGQIKESLKSFDLGDLSIQPSGDNLAILRFKNISEEVHQQIILKLKQDFNAKNNENQQEETGEVVETMFDSVGPSIGQELRRKSYQAIIYVNIVIIIYIAWSFRKVSRPISSWKYGVAAVIALIHDVTITVGVFVFLGHYLDVEVNTPFIAALLTILGYSVNDTIVVFDRTRENLHRYHENFEETVNNSVNETFVRSLNTSLTTIFTLIAVYFFGGESVKYFALALIVGITAGTYSSIFVASPILVTWHKLSERFRSR